MREVARAPTTTKRGGRERDVCDPGRSALTLADDTRLEVYANLAEKFLAATISREERRSRASAPQIGAISGSGRFL